MTKSIERFCSLPRHVHDGDHSIFDLINASEFSLEELDPVAVEAVLKQNPEYADEWLQWSEDQRSSSGYYVAALKDRYVVGRVPGDGVEAVFADKLAAVADFIVKQIGAVLQEGASGRA